MDESQVAEHELHVEPFDDSRRRRAQQLHGMLQPCRFTVDQFFQAFLKQPTLFRRRPESLFDNVVASASLLALPRNTFVGLALKYPSLLNYTPEALRQNARLSAQLLGLARGAFLASALKQPQLLCQSPRTLSANVSGAARRLDVSKAAFVHAAMRRPSLLCQRPETLQSNVSTVAQALDLELSAMVAAGMKSPGLLCLKPATILANVSRSAALLGVDRALFASAAIKQPQLFYHDPEFLSSKVPYLQAIQVGLGQEADIGWVLAHAPTALCYGKDHLHAKYVLARLGLKKCSFASLVCLPRRIADRLIIEHFQSQIAATGRGRRTLQVLHAKGVLTSLPENLAALPSET